MVLIFVSKYVQKWAQRKYKINYDFYNEFSSSSFTILLKAHECVII